MRLARNCSPGTHFRALAEFMVDWTMACRGISPRTGTAAKILVTFPFVA